MLQIDFLGGIKMIVLPEGQGFFDGIIDLFIGHIDVNDGGAELAQTEVFEFCTGRGFRKTHGRRFLMGERIRDYLFCYGS